MNKKVYRVLKTIVIAIIVISLILSFVVSHDLHHLDTCEVEHCSVCCIIQGAQSIVNMTVSVFVFVLTSFMIYFCLARMYEQVRVWAKKSLIFQKVQLNE